MQDKDIQTWPLELGPDTGLVLKGDGTAITVLPVEPDGTPRIEASADALKHMKLDIGRVGTDIEVKLRYEKELDLRNWFDWRSRRLTVFLPRGVNATVRAEAGKVTARDLAIGTLDIEADAGVIVLSNVRAQLRLRANAGRIQGEDLAGSLNAAASTGAINFRIRELDPGSHVIKADVGAVKLEIANTAKVQIETEASLGTVRTDFSSTPGAAATLRVSASVGSVKIRGVDLGSPLPEKPEHAPMMVTPARVPAESELERVLKLVEEGKLSAQDAGEILKALQGH